MIFRTTHSGMLFSLLLGICSQVVYANTLEQRLLAEDPAQLAESALQHGDAARGAVLYHQPFMACTRCHDQDGSAAQRLGPSLVGVADGEQSPTNAMLVDAILRPSQRIAQAYRAVTLQLQDGTQVTGRWLDADGDRILVLPASGDLRPLEVESDQVEARIWAGVSLMPTGQVNLLASRQQFLDLVRYLMAIRDGGASKALALRPPESLRTPVVLPEYESKLDHAGMIGAWGPESHARGKVIYERVCANCHGTRDRVGSLPTALRFTEDKFKNGNDPLTMYSTLTRGFGMMVPQTWMVPQQKYDVIHYIRETFLREGNTSQYYPVDKSYLSSLPQGDTRGPAPVNIEPWVRMDYGQSLTATYQIPGQPRNLAYKGIAVRLDAGPGGIARGRHWMVFDHDTMRMAGAWQGDQFIDWRGINFDGAHGVHPRTVGGTILSNPIGPGWARPEDGTWEDPRLKGRDGRVYGPLPRAWAQYRGLYHHGQRRIIAYDVGQTNVLEMPGLDTRPGGPALYTRMLNLGPRPTSLVLQVARTNRANAHLEHVSVSSGAGVVVGDRAEDAPQSEAIAEGQQFYQVSRSGDDVLDMERAGFTIFARIKTDADGTILAKTTPGSIWVRDGKTLFVNRGHLVFDIGWVGEVRSKRPVADGQPHDVAVTWNPQDGKVSLYIDGQVDQTGTLRSGDRLRDSVVRLGYTNADFPAGRSSFVGELQEVRVYQRALSSKQMAGVGDQPARPSLRGYWNFADTQASLLEDRSTQKHHAQLKSIADDSESATLGDEKLMAGLRGAPARWELTARGDLLLVLPAGDEPLQCTLWMARQAAETVSPEQAFASLAARAPDPIKLTTWLQGGPTQYPETLVTQVGHGKDEGPFAVDVLRLPVDNPWFCRLRMTGLDFFADGDRLALCTWDGSVWIVTGLKGLGQPAAPLRWRRFASGMFQPLGLKILDDVVHVTCRDQLVRLHDRNDDGEVDFYECVNNDHQVTEHFHEFAMGLQVDEDRNFYYAKSARHALKAVVPHHGTLLRIASDGSRTDILANGFRAPNGVCLNPDGSFIVTDQEGHWNPKNRINWVRSGGFYGNMFGYHDQTEASDEAMQQPLCWITNQFDRSPAELLWVKHSAWGPLEGSLLNLSYGYGQIFVVPHEQIDGQMQGGMCALPIPRFPTGVMRGRFHPDDGQLYTCGMFAWAGNQHQPGGLYRVRYTGQPVYLPLTLNARSQQLRIRFSGNLDPHVVRDRDRYAVKTWSLKRTANYGSKHYDERSLKVASAKLLDDGQTVAINLPDLAPTWSMEVKFDLKSQQQTPVRGVIHNTIHRLAP